MTAKATADLGDNVLNFGRPADSWLRDFSLCVLVTAYKMELRQPAGLWVW